jgi:integrase
MVKRGRKPVTVHRLKTTNQAVKWKVKAKPYGGKRQALTQNELDRLFTALKGNRHGHRDYMVALVTFLHGLRVSELIDLRWNDIDYRKGTIAIRRLKGSIDGTHYLERDEAVGLKQLQREQEPRRPHIFTSERGEAFSRFAINKMIATAARGARITWPVHPHCLRHTTGTMQANGGMDAWRLSKLMGHASIANTTKYVRMSPEPLKDAWRGKR